MVILMYERELLYMIFIRGNEVVNFNVSCTKDNAHAKFLDTFSVGVTVTLFKR